jgi:hypothetical protein
MQSSKILGAGNIGGKVKRLKPFSFVSFLTSLAFLLTLCGCQSSGGFHDMAFVKQAQKGIRGIRNALEEYKIDHGTYPGPDCDLGTALTPYVSKTMYSEGKGATEFTRAVLAAQNNFNQVGNATSGCSRIRDIRVKEAYARIVESLKSYERVLGGVDEDILPVGVEIAKLQNLIDELDPAGTKTLNKTVLIETAGRIIAVTELLAETGEEEGVKHLHNIKSTFQWYKANLEGKKLEEEIERYSPETEIVALKEVVAESSVVELEELVNSYCELESARDYYDFLMAVHADLDRALQVASMLDESMVEAKTAAVVVQAQANLHRMADAIRDHRREEGTFPEAGTDIDSILHPYFVEETMSGERIDRWEDALDWFSEGPTYTTEDCKVNFEIRARVSNEPRTHIAGKVEVQNQWTKIVGVFSEPPVYQTPDSSRTYFLKGRAKDSGLTWVTERPPVAGGKG